MRLQTVALAALVLVPMPASAQVFQAASNIVLTECNPHLHTAAEAHPWVDPYGNAHYNPTPFPSWDAFLMVGFTNQGTKAATEVDFGLVSSGSLVAVAKDVGTFAPGVAVEHEFAVSREIFPLGIGTHCTVQRVKYADGSTWPS
jgi:hypothetical protein